jgi:chromosome segregation ATPase
LRNPTSVGWESWAVVLHAAVADEDRWMQAMLSLSLEDQFSLLEVLKTETGIYADALLVITGRHAHEVEDEQLREWLLTDAAESATRFGDRLEHQREVLSSLTNRHDAEPGAAVDAAAEVARLQARLYELNGAAIGTDYEQARRLERDVLRLEALARSLDGYDADGRRGERDAMKSQTDELTRMRDELEADLERHRGDRDKALRDRASLERDIAELAQEHTRLVEANEATKRDITARNGELDTLRREHTSRSTELKQLENEVADKRRQVEAESSRLDELRSSRSVQANDRVLAKVNELYALLPADGAEADVTDRTAEGTRR